MARISGVDLPREKRVEIGLTYVYGIGRASANKILEAAKVNPDTRVRDLTDDEVKRISAVIDADYQVEGELRREIALNIKRLQEDMKRRYFDAPDLQDVGKNAYRFMNAVSDFATHSTPLRKTANYKENLFSKTVDGNPLIDKAYQMVKAA